MADSSQIRQYHALDVEWLEVQAKEIVTSNDLFNDFERVAPYPARVVRDRRGSIYGLSLDQALAEFRAYERIMKGRS